MARPIFDRPGCICLYLTIETLSILCPTLLCMSLYLIESKVRILIIDKGK